MTGEAHRLEAKPWIAAFPMYDFPELAAAHDLLWSALRPHLIDAGVADSPRGLTRGLPHEATWRHPSLLLGQACEYPLAKYSAQPVRLVASPRYRAPGCAGATYRSVILVRQFGPTRTLADLKDSRCVINDPRSNSGMNLLRAAIAPYSHGGRFFSSVVVSGSHRESLRKLAAGEADVAAVDCVSWAHLQRIEPTAAALRALDWSPSTPSLPFVTAASADDALLQRLRSALRALSADPRSRAACEALYLDGFDLNPKPEFSAVLYLEREAASSGYPELA